MEFESEIIDKTTEEVQKILNNRIRMGWQIHSISTLSQGYHSTGHYNSYGGKITTGGSIWNGPIVITYMRLSEADKKIGETLQIIAENLSKNL